MFYDDNQQSALRFGDVVGGFLLTHCHTYSPSPAEKPDAFQIAVTHPELAVVLTPCCTIAHRSGGMLILSPLLKIRPDWYFENSYLREDFTRINRETTIQNALGPEIWAGMSDEQQVEQLAQSPGKRYMMDDFFAYDKHGLLPEYDLRFKGGKRASINYYMIDFRNICRVQTATGNNPTSTKRLQLSIQGRGELRDKLAHYFGRRPEEDALGK